MDFASELKKQKKRYYKKNALKLASTICNQLGDHYRNCGKYELALEEHLEELNVCCSLDCEIDMAVAHRKIGEVYGEMKKWVEAKSHLDKYLEKSTNEVNYTEMQRAHATLGDHYFMRYETNEEIGAINSSRELLNQAENHFHYSLGYCKKLDDTLAKKETGQMRCRIYHNLGLTADRKGNTGDSIKLLHQALNVANMFALHDDVIRVHQLLSEIYFKQNNIEKALQEAKSALRLAIRESRNDKICDCHNQVAQMYLVNENYNFAKKQLYKAFKLGHPNIHNRSIIKLQLKAVANVCYWMKNLKECTDKSYAMKLCENIADKLVSFRCFAHAINYYKKMEKLAEEQNADCKCLIRIYTSLAETYKDNTEYELAIEYYSKELTLHSNASGINVKEVCNIYISLAKISELKALKHEAESYLKEAMSVAKKHCKPKIMLKILYYNINLKGITADSKNVLEQEKSHIESKYNIADCSSSEESEIESENEIETEDITDSDEEILQERKTRGKRTALKGKTDIQGNTALHLAAIKGDVNRVKVLLENKICDVNSRCNAGWTPLHEAANMGKLEVAQLLVEHKADLNAKGSDDVTPLIDALEGGQMHIARFFINAGACLDKTRSGNTPLDTLVSYKKRCTEPFTAEEIQEYNTTKELIIKTMEDAGMKVKASYKTFEFDVNAGDECLSTKELSDEDLIIKPDVQHKRKEVHSMGKLQSKSSTIMYKEAIAGVRKSAQQVTIETASDSYSIPAMVPRNEVLEEDWLEDDLGIYNPTKKIKRSPTFIHFEHRRKKQTKQQNLPKLMKRLSTKRETDDRGYSEKTSELDEFECDKHFNDILEINDHDENVKIHFFDSFVDKEVSNKHSFDYPSDTHNFSNFNTSQTLEVLRLNVLIENKKLLVPIPPVSRKQKIGWLQNEVAKCYYNNMGVKPSKVKLSTVEDSLLNSDDIIDTVISGDTKELKATVSSWQLPCMSQRYAEACNRDPYQDVVFALKEASCSGIVDVSNCHLMCEADVEPVITSLRHYSNIHTLTFNNCYLSKMAAMLIETLPTLTSLQQINLQNCGLQADFFVNMANSLTNSAIKKSLSLDFSYNGLSQLSYANLRVLLMYPTLNTLNLSHCFLELDSEAFITFASTIQSLFLSGNCISYYVLYNLLSSCISLTELDISGCVKQYTVNNGPSFGSAICSLLANQSNIERLDISDCGMLDSDLEVISLSLYKCSKLKYLSVAYNSQLTYASIDLMLKEICKNQDIFLQELHLNNIACLSICNDLVAALSPLIKRKQDKATCLKRLFVPYYRDLEMLWLSVHADKAVVKVYNSVLYLSLE